MEMIRYEQVDEKARRRPAKDGDSDSDLYEGVHDRSLLAVLDDKNRSIELLQKQIHNQKIQLGFYLHRVLHNPKILEMSENCLPFEAEENLQLNLAMTKFCKQAGLKSRIMTLHGRMGNIEKRILGMTQTQEEMVLGIVSTVADLMQTVAMNAGNAQSVLTQLKSDPQMQSLAKVFNATTKLRKELDTFRTCCNRLIVIEDERNSLVDQVYAMPVSQRLGYAVIVGAQYEKMRLEKEVEEIKHEQNTLHERISYFTRTRPQYEGDRNLDDDSTQNHTPVHQMLEAVNMEAVTLLSLAKEQKDKYSVEIAQLKDSNMVLSAQVESLEEIAQEKTEMEGRIALAVREFEKFKECNESQFHDLTVKLEVVTAERNSLHQKLHHYHDIEEQVKSLRVQVDDMNTIRKQRDYYKSQVDDLQAIRAAYSQLVEHPSATIRGVGDDKKEAHKVEELENERHKMAGELQRLGEIIGDQELQVKYLLLILDKLGPCQAQIKRSTVSSQTPKCALQTTDGARNAVFDRDFFKRPSLAKLNVHSQTESSLQLASFDEQKSASTRDQSTIYDWPSPPLGPSGSIRQLIRSQAEEVGKVRSPKQESSNSRGISIVGTPDARSSLVSTTTVEVQSVSRDGKSESLKATLESSSSIDRVIQINNSSALSLRVTCGSNKKSVGTNSLVAPTSRVGEEETAPFASVTDEFELMKDASNETMAVTLPTVRRQKANMVQMQRVEYKCSTEEAVWNKGDTSFMGILRKDDEDVNVIISRETMPSDNVSEDDESERDNSNEVESETVSTRHVNYKKVDVAPCCEVFSNARAKEMRDHTTDLTYQLGQVATNLDRTLARPDGRALVLNTIKVMYRTFMSSDFKH